MLKKIFNTLNYNKIYDVDIDCKCIRYRTLKIHVHNHHERLLIFSEHKYHQSGKVFQEKNSYMIVS